MPIEHNVSLAEAKPYISSGKVYRYTKLFRHNATNQTNKQTTNPPTNQL